ncbi:MAG TPA: NAD(P)-binding domain-containing protein [Candidatus Baltobacteraceae bacterium]|nr:NAD(P)-binding domain-containing protein [Candidatus Baltobacteraceae bacterium]
MDARRRMISRREFLLAGIIAVTVATAIPGPALAAGSSEPLKIGMVGAGREGSALGALFIKAGHPVMFSSRHPESLQGLVSGLGPLAKAGTVEEAIAFGDVVVILVPYTAMEQIGKSYAGALAQKALVMDVSNPIARRDGEDFVKSVDAQGGAGLMTAKLLPGAPVVRAFNAIGATQLPTLAHRAGDPVGMPIAGDNPQAIAVAERLTREIGFEPVVVGGLAIGRYLVPGTPLAGVHTPAEIRQIASTLR